MSRGGFAIVQIRNDGSVNKGIYGPLQEGMEQSSMNAECVALALAAAVAEPGAVYVGDCQSVLDVYDGDPLKAIGADSPYACDWISLDRKVDLRTALSSVTKTKAHRNRDVIVDVDELFMFDGNFEADRLAKLGAGLHPPQEEDLKGYKSAKASLRKVAEHMVDVLGVLRLSRVEQQSRVTRLPRGLRWRNPNANADGHKFMWINNIWSCVNCVARTHNPSSLCPSRRRCHGIPSFAPLFDKQHGHDLFIATLRGGGVFVYCARCFCYASPYPRKLSCACDGDARNNPTSRFYIKRGKCSVSRRQLMKPIRMSQASRGLDLL